MDKTLLATLINNGVVKEGTEVSVRRKGLDLGASLNVTVEELLEIYSVEKVKGNFLLRAFRTSDGRKFTVKAEHIGFIDGMPPSRLVTAHKSEGKKRGRKSKKR